MDAAPGETKRGNSRRLHATHTLCVDPTHGSVVVNATPNGALLQRYAN
jgi:hypothetical protein